MKKALFLQNRFLFSCFFFKKLLNVNISSKQTQLHAFTTQDVLELLVNSFSAAADGICSYNNENLVFFQKLAIDVYTHAAIVMM